MSVCSSCEASASTAGVSFGKNVGVRSALMERTLVATGEGPTAPLLLLLLLSMRASSPVVLMVMFGVSGGQSGTHEVRLVLVYCLSPALALTCALASSLCEPPQKNSVEWDVE